MMTPGVHIWVWMRDGGNLMRAKIDYTKGTLIVYSNDHLLVVRIGLSQKQLKQMEKEIESKGGKRLNLQSGPFVFIKPNKKTIT